MKLNALIICSFIAGAVPTSALATANATGTNFVARGVNHNGTGNAYPYRLFLPDGYSTSGTQQYPIVLFMHGLGERGTDNLNQVTGAGAPILGLVTGSNRDN